MKLKLPYLVEEQAGGRTYHYVRKGKGPRVAITAQPGTAEFGRQYADALNALSHGQAQVSAPRFQWRHLVSAYLNSAAVQRLHPETRRVRRRVLEQFLHDWAAKDYRKLEALDVIEVLEQKARRPEAAITRLKAIRAVLNYAVRRELVATNVALSEKVAAYAREELRRDSGGHKAWTRELIARFYKHYELGEREHLLMTLLLYTGCRISDAAMLGPQHERAGFLVWNETKGRGRYAKDATAVPILPPLRAAIDAAPTGDMVYMVTELGLSYSVKGLAQWFVKRCREAGIPAGYTAHGVRKAAATMIAEAGASEDELMSMFGWQSSKQARVYTRTANRQRLAASAARRLYQETLQEQGAPSPAPNRKVYNG